ncbi:MAG TPA: helix-turn-helix domain-containing protein [Thermoleophilaceae bacterium]|nr:helix-turn-helix domain-containing protein [Thermoleophilaceae bacterium]
MASAQRLVDGASETSFLEAMGEVSQAVEAGAGLPTVVRAAAHALNASVVVMDPSGGVLAVACLSREDERAVIAGESGSERIELRVADQPGGELRFRARAGPPPAALVRMVGTLIALEAERARAPERATEAAVGDFLRDLLSRKVTERHEILARAEELNCDLSDGACVIVVRARPQHPEEGDWRARVLTSAERGARSVERSSLAAGVELGVPRSRPRAPGGDPRHRRPERDPVLLVPGHGAELARRAAAAVSKELEAGLHGFAVVVGLSRPTPDPSDLHRAGAEALLAANVADARGLGLLPFDETGAYRLLLPAMSEDSAELRRFHEETVAPLVAYDEQYETELVRTLETFLESDGNIAKTAEKLFAHRHTIRYRLDRVRELSGLDVASSDGRERLSLGLKAMRVLGISPPGGPAWEAGSEGGRVPSADKDR